MVKKIVKKQKWIFRLTTSNFRQMPSFLIIGAQKCGTTFLYDSITKHPEVEESWFKEPKYFSTKYDKMNIYQYKAFFNLSNKKISGDASANYLFHPLAPKRMKALLPDAKIIILLRNPIDRAYSHYHQTARRGKEELTFEEAIKKENERISDITKEIMVGNNRNAKKWLYYSYISRGKYAKQIKNWLRYFSKNQILIINSKDFFIKPEEIYSQVIKFIGLTN